MIKISLNYNRGVKSVKRHDGSIHYLKYGKLHREDGPAIEYPDGVGFYYLDGFNYPPTVWEKEVFKRKLEKIKSL